ncbi:MAG: fumarylacetoacetate hydrolase family protein [Actinomycetota bacterium]|jgi:2-keto-4-pentenoate hydratase/2-oxohepta-3-ene-1,7-dioic acid hydratase in catechol pathway|nr:fumarylacetoacetate hydrolase family protein [Solirubrobacterales bacterium]MDQ3091986.1 fumarylacetoacetate hydrolase family protein [Actinomycetota bacterium]
MRLATFLPPGATAPVAGEIRGDEAIAFADDPAATVLGRLTTGDRSPATGGAHPLDQVRLLAPVPRPRAIFGIGLNYAAHAAEQGRERPDTPIVFMKLPGSSVAPNEPVDPPRAVRRRLDYEGELVVVMGAGNSVGGYAVANDLSARDLQGREPQWTRAKGFDGACPWGPWITTADEAGDPHDLRLRTWVNGEPRQDARTSDLIFTVPRLVDHLAQTCTLEPGDLILTGTPNGVGVFMDPKRFLEAGDTIRIEIERLGTIEHAIA